MRLLHHGPQPSKPHLTLSSTQTQEVAMAKKAKKAKKAAKKAPAKKAKKAKKAKAKK
jgi:hypothetical protein